jgi:hypothetical protein
MVFDSEAELLQQPRDARRPQRGRPHQRACLRSADFNGNAEQGYRPVSRRISL